MNDTEQRVVLDDEDMQIIAAVGQRHAASRVHDFSTVQEIIAVGAELTPLREKHRPSRDWQALWRQIEQRGFAFNLTQANQYLRIYRRRDVLIHALDEHLKDPSADPLRHGGAAGCDELIRRRLKPDHASPKSPRKSPRRNQELAEQLRCSEECVQKLARCCHDRYAERREVPTVLNECDAMRLRLGLPPLAIEAAPSDDEEMTPRPDAEGDRSNDRSAEPIPERKEVAARRYRKPKTVG